MLTLDIYLVKKAYREYLEDGCLSIVTYATLLEFGIDPDTLENSFEAGDTPFEENIPVTFLATQEDVDEILDAAIGNHIERLIDIKDACNNILEED